MKSLKNIVSIAVLGAAAVLPVAGHAQATAPPTAAATAATPSTPVSATGEMTEAEVRQVDVDNKKITLKHGVITNLDMPPMTMVFGVSDAALLDKVKSGDKVRFKANNDGGKYTVTEMRPAR